MFSSVELYVRVHKYSDQGGTEMKLQPEKLSGLDPHHSTQLCFHPPTDELKIVTWEYGSDLRLELASIRKSDAFSMAANDFGISDFIFKSWEELIVSRPTLKNKIAMHF